MKASKRLSVRQAARALADNMNAAIGKVDAFADFAPIVVEQCRGIGGAVWLTYDDAGGNAHSWTAPNFHKVRQVRNSPAWCKALSDAINSKAAK